MLHTVLLLVLSLFAYSQAIAWDINTDRPGKDYKSFELQQANPIICEKACQRDPQCQAWTYVKPGVQGPKARCYLKSAQPPAVSNTCCVSGIKGQTETQPPVKGSPEEKPLPTAPSVTERGTFFIAGDKHGKVNIFNQKGEKIGSFDANYTANDGFAVGDVNGDGKAEIIIAGDVHGNVDIWDGTGKKIRSFHAGFTKDDAFGVGDVNGDGVDEIIMHGNVHGNVNVFTMVGGKLARFSTWEYEKAEQYRTYSAISGGLTLPGTREIILGWAQKRVIHWGLATRFDKDGLIAWNLSGNATGVKNHAFTKNDRMALCDINSDGVLEIAVAGDMHKSVTVFKRHAETFDRIMSFIADYTKGDGFACHRSK